MSAVLPGTKFVAAKCSLCSRCDWDLRHALAGVVISVINSWADFVLRCWLPLSLKKGLYGNKCLYGPYPEPDESTHSASHLVLSPHLPTNRYFLTTAICYTLRVQSFHTSLFELHNVCRLIQIMKVLIMEYFCHLLFSFLRAECSLQHPVLIHIQFICFS